MKSFESADGVAFYEISRSETTWAANQPTTVKYYEDADSDPLTPVSWILKGDYTFTGGLCTKLIVYQVVMNVVQPTIAAQWDYSFNTSNQLITDVQSGGFGDARVDYTYLANGLLDVIDRQEDQGAGLFTYRYVKFYYTDVTGIKENTLDFTVFPNPTADKVVFSTTCDKLSVYNMKGELVLTQNNTNTIDLSAFVAGNYVIKASNGSATGSQTIVKK